ncbi:hypothetical protein NQZ79_g5093 [Umbelopsis isabellina]|nr:hypothetical protein NQZ79_g5093 [Umbelopsis isabellina]
MLLILNEIRTPVFVSENFRFLGLNLGRGLLFLFFGCVILDTVSFNIIVGILSWTVGLLYMIISFVPNIPHPNALIINWQTWKEFSSEGLDLYNPVATPARSRTFHPNQLGENEVHTSVDRTLLMPNHNRPSPMAHVVERHFAQPPIRPNTYVNDSTPDLSIIETMRSTSAI